MRTVSMLEGMETGVSWLTSDGGASDDASDGDATKPSELEAHPLPGLASWQRLPLYRQNPGAAQQKRESHWPPNRVWRK
jgi:hypothetical protein